MSVFISPARRSFAVANDYPFGGKSCKNVLEQFHGVQKEIKVLFLNCQDLRNVLQTVGFKKEKSASPFLSIHLNHPSPLSLARNILIFQVISSATFDVDNKEDISYLWDLWYNLQWTKSTCTRFEKDVKSLMDTGFGSSNKLHFALNKSQKRELKNIVGHWSSAIKSELILPSQINGIKNERLEFIRREVRDDLSEFAGRDHSRTIPESLLQLSTWCDTAMETNGFPETLKKKLSQETLAYFESGTCNSSRTENYQALNPTLLEPNTFHWRVDVTSSPFDTYCPMDLVELESSAQEGIATRYCQEKLKKLVAEFRRKKRSTEFYFYLCDDLKALILGCEVKFDVIDCSTLADEVGLANLIASASQKLESHQHALLLTESFQWGTVASTIPGYVENSLCAPLSMLPTIYGLRVANQVELGREYLIERKYPAGFPPVTLCWRQTTRFEKAVIGYSPALERFIMKLEKKCFFDGDDQNLIPNGNCGFQRYTPLTFSIIATNLAEVMKKEDGKPFNFKPEMSSQFALAYRTLEEWANGRQITQLTAVQPNTSHVDQMVLQNQKTSLLRLALVPSDFYSNYMIRHGEQEDVQANWPSEIPNAHYIDNFDLCNQDNEKGSSSSSTLRVSFLLPKDHGLEKTHCAVIIDLISNLVIMSFGEIKDIKQVRYGIAHPSSKHLFPTSEVGSHTDPQRGLAKISKCEESESDYVIEISVDPKVFPLVSGFSFRSDRVFPCHSAHKITFTMIPRLESVQPVTFSFPFPVLNDGIECTISLNQSFSVVVKKALFEPWPSDFNNPARWNVSELTPFPLVPFGDQDCLTDHHTHEGQCTEETFRKYEESKILKTKLSLDTMEEVRGIIISFFTMAKGNYEAFSIFDNDNFDNELMQLLIHRPIVKSPLGSPMLLLSVCDLELLRHYIANGNYSEDQAQKDHNRIFGGASKKIIIFQHPMATKEATDILRYTLRLNSTKILPTKWQRERFPSTNYSPFMATFLAPLYLDNQHPFDVSKFEMRKVGISITIAESGIPVKSGGNRCTGCLKQSTGQLKRCSKCRVASYCSVECQRTDWKKHKLNCSPG